jgi:hypothetical protein
MSISRRTFFASASALPALALPGTSAEKVPQPPPSAWDQIGLRRGERWNRLVYAPYGETDYIDLPNGDFIYSVAAGPESVLINCGRRVYELRSDSGDPRDVMNWRINALLYRG